MSDLNTFLKAYPPGNTAVAPADLVSQYQGLLPAALLTLWKTSGLGKYGGGLIEVVNPNDFLDTMQTWLAKRPANYVPVAISAFGEFFYYRKLTPTDEDVCMIDPHYSQIRTCVWSLEGFFNDWLCDPGLQEDVLRKPLFEEAVEKYGPLADHEIFMFQPALPFGGGESLASLGKGNAQVHLEILFQMRSA